MELRNEFRVGVPVEQAWAVLIDVERIAPCMPGAELREVEGDEYRGVVKVKVGPITAEYRGKATFLEQDEQAHRAVLRAEGRETRGQGNANATITAVLEPDGEGTRASVVTDLAVTGRVAQFGRGVLADVSAKLLTQFVSCLEETVLADGSASTGSSAASDGSSSGAAVGGGAPAASTSASPSGIGGGAASSVAAPAAATGAPSATAPPSAAAADAVGPRTIPSRPAEPVNLLDVAGGSVMKRLLPVAAGVAAVGLVVGSLLWRRRRR